MARVQMTSTERVVTALSHREPDRVPRMLLFSVYGARELELPIRDYFSSPDQVIRVQLQLRTKYRGDCVSNFFYAAQEVEAWGGEVIFYDDGPPNSGTPVVGRGQSVFSLEPPRIDGCPTLLRVLEVTAGLRRAVGDDVPVLGTVISPFSLPVMQLGFERYLDMIYFRPEEFRRLMAVNLEFCAAWAGAQLQAGATAIGYFNPLASPTIIDKATYLATGYATDQAALSRIPGPVVMHLASGLTLPVLEEIIAAGAVALGFSCRDRVAELKRAAKGRICLLGNLNALEMVHWDERQAEDRVRDLLAQAGAGGGLLLADNHGDIPWQMPDRVLRDVAAAIDRWGNYPLEWVD